MSRMNRRNFLQLAGVAPLGMALEFGNYRSRKAAAAPERLKDPWLDINLKHMAWNVRQLRKQANNRPIMAVIKANAYGHGLVPVARYLQRQNIHALAVGKVQEAIKLREYGIRLPILNFGPFSRENANELVRRSISQSVYTEEFRYLIEAAKRVGRKASVHVKIDTGLGRVGVPHDQAIPLLEAIARHPEIRIEGIFTTFSEDEEFDQIQLQRFHEVCRQAKKRGIAYGKRHAASSAGILSFPESHLDMVRPGITLYGHYPSEKELKRRRIDLKPVMSLKARVSYVKTLRPGDSVAYHRAFIASQETRVATIPVGYADGMPYQIAGKAGVLIRGHRFPTIALITANHLTADVSSAPTPIRIDDEVVLIGRQGEQEITAEEVARLAGTSVYKILIWMNPELPRVYHE